MSEWGNYVEYDYEKIDESCVETEMERAHRIEQENAERKKENAELKKENAELKKKITELEKEKNKLVLATIAQIPDYLSEVKDKFS